jgi:hypothetical protein
MNVDLEDQCVGAALAGYGQRVIDMVTPDDCARHGLLLAAAQHLAASGALRHRYDVVDGRVVYSVAGLERALQEVGHPAPHVGLATAEQLIADLPLATFEDVRQLREVARLRRLRVAAVELERGIAEGRDVTDEERALREAMGASA